MYNEPDAKRQYSRFKTGKTERNGAAEMSIQESETAGSGKEKADRTVRRKRLLRASACLLFALALILLADGRKPKFYMTGGQEIETSYGQPFEEPGIYAVLSGRLFGDGRRLLPILTEGSVDPNTLGSYELKYSTRFLLREFNCTRTVKVADLTAPVITLENRYGYQVNWLDGYEEEGYHAIDDVDGDLTDRVSVEETDDGILYSVQDAAGNRAETVRHPQYSLARPKLSLNGEPEMHILASLEEFQDPGCTAGNATGDDLTDRIRTGGRVIPYSAGVYELVYSVTNAKGVTVSATRRVTVDPVERPETVYPEKKTVYLTFDDGPGPYTDMLLDVLDRCGVRATFFVTGENPNHAACIRRAYEAGHAIGVHTASHKYREIYADESAFFEDFMQVQELIYRQTGSYTRICRFPGGSSNTVSSFNPGIMTRLAKALEDLGYVYFDWDVASGDAGETTDTETVYRNVIDGIKDRQTSVVLQHDIKKYSVAAVEKIILWGQSNGYEFKTLDLTSPPTHLTIAN